MFKINTNDIHPNAIREMVSSPMVYARGEDYFFADNVGDMYYDLHNRMIRAEVQGSKVYQCKVFFKPNGNLYHTSCGCEAYASYPGVCKHLVALLFEIDEYMSNRDYNQKKNSVSQGHYMINAFKKTFKPGTVAVTEKDTIQLQYELQFRMSTYSKVVENIYLRLRAGVKRPYLVKNIEEFISAVQQKESYTFTDNFRYNPEQHRIEEEDLALLQLIRKIDEGRNFGRPYHLGKRDKALLVPDLMVPDLFELLEGRQVVQKSGNTKPATLNVEPFHTEGKLELLLQKYDSIELVVNENEYVFFHVNHRVLKKAGTLFRLNEQQATVIDTLLGSIRGESTRFDDKDMEAFSSYVLPKLKEVATIHMDETLTNVIQHYPLKAKLKLDSRENALHALVTFQYGETEVNPYAEKKSEKDAPVLVRDVEKEAVIHSLLKRTPFSQAGEELVLGNENEMALFLFEELPSLQEYVDIYTTSSVRQMISPLEKQPSVSLSANEETNWLDVSFSMGGIPDGEVDEVLAALRRNHTYYRLPNGAFLHLQGESFEDVKKAIDHFAPAKGKVGKEMSVPLYHALSLEEDKAQPFKFSSSLRQLMNDIKRPDFMEAEAPDAINASLREYQLTGFRWLKTLAHFGLGGILADDMGLGKTLQTITFLQALADEKTGLRTLIVTPASLSYNWEKEFQRFAPELTVAVIAGNKEERHRKLEANSDTQVLITSYPLIQREADLYQNEPFDVLILDEAQAIKNDFSKTAKAVRSLQASSTFALTGTPIENRLEELYSIFHTLVPGILGTKKAFNEMESETVSKRVRPFILRRLKKDVLTELPDKVEQVQYINLTEDQKKLYVAQVKRLAKDVDSAIGNDQFQEQRMQILAGLTKLRQICCHPELVLPGETYKSGKFERLLEYVEEGLASSQRMVIFSQFTSMLSLIRSAFEERGWLYHYLDGQTPAQERLALTERFNEGEHSLFLISMKAGGTGLNLTGGDTVILFDTWWNPAVEQQAADRVYRFGQKKNVQVVKLITSGTIEEKMMEMQERKKALVEEVITPGEQLLTGLRAEDIKDLLSVQ
ncbi:DEAD/DEAH box helicase [Shouchella shacheensis]|uniref:DEAD/DEAH box helicase n=1 Tax=Shouchella shacheensis TaxID=1649580 RepID=UPI0007400EE6|nr:DEAD/DEAH box helicase [Shouchella shacheensis]